MSLSNTPSRNPARPRLHCLEGREVPAVIYAVTNSQRIQTFDSSNPGVLLNAASISGLKGPGEKITDIDVRLGDGALIGRSNQGRIYRINQQTGASAQVGDVLVGGANVGIDFDPNTGGLQVVNFSGGSSALDLANNSINSAAGRLGFVNGDVFQGTPQLAGIGFTTGTGTAASRLFGIDPVRDTLVTGVGNGQFATVGSLGIDVGNSLGFDVDSTTGLGFASFQPAGSQKSFLSVIDLSSGKSAVLGTVGPTAPLILDIAVSETHFSPGTTLPAALDFSTVGFLPTALGGIDVNGTGINGNGINTNGVNTGVVTGFNPNGTLFNPDAVRNGFNLTGLDSTGFTPGIGTTGPLAGTGFATVPTAVPFSPLIQPLGPNLIGSSINSFNSFGPTIPGLPSFNSSVASSRPTFTSPGTFGTSDSFTSPFTDNGFSTINSMNRPAF